ncbi:RND family efflux transporter MFP subunit [Thermopolyspora flexuosa]|uniref:RND family efflux transporter MFP subunit n=2 Tax=Thermopolyspora flexuosa TaxID=103836 RepID=A0A543IS34_9ACTN|nr:RND family efflux transporter MFP subunit [Thermopolyspora flexuosa]
MAPMRSPGSSTVVKIGAIVLAGVVVLGAALLSLGGGDTSPEARATLVAAARGTVTSVVSAAGTTVDANTRELAFGADGTVEKVYVKVGDKVDEGQLLAKIDGTRARERYEEAKARLAAAEETLENIRNGTGGAGSAAAGRSGGTAAAGGGASAAGRGATASGRGSSGTAGRPTATSSPTADPSCLPSATRSRGTTSRDGRAEAATGGLVVRPAAYTLTGYGTAPDPASGKTATPQPTATVTATQSVTATPTAQPAPTVTVTVTATPTVTVTQTVTVRPTVTVTATVTQTVTATPAPAPTATRPPAVEPTPTSPGGGLVTSPPASTQARGDGGSVPGTPSATPSTTPSCGTAGGGQGTDQGQGGQGQGGANGQARGQGQGRGAIGNPGSGGAGGAGGSRTGGGGQSEAQAEAAVTQAKSELQAAKEALAGVVIRAPRKGTILSIAGAAGDSVSANTAFITLGDLDELQVKAMVTQSDVEKLKVGQKAEVILATRPGERHAGRVVHIDPTATTSGDLVRYGVLIAFTRRPKDLLLGQNATITVTTGESVDAVYVPAQAARLRSDGTAVVTVATGDGTAERTVRTGVRGDQYVEIVEGLQEGDKVVLPASASSGEFPDGSFPGLDATPSATPS